MSDNFPITPGSGRKAATDEVTHSGETADVALVRLVLTTGAEGSKTVIDLPGDNANGLDVDVTRSALPSGASTSAKQDTIISHLDGVEGLLGTIDADTGDIATNTGLAAASLSVVDDWDEGDRAKVNPIAGQAGVQGGSGAVSALTQRVVLATDIPLPTGTNSIGQVTANAGTNLNTSALALESGGNLAGAATSLAIMDDWDESDRLKANIIVGQAGVQAGAGSVSASTQRVTLASDDPAVVALQAPSAIKWEGQWTDRSTVLGTELNSLADAARTVAGTEVDNSVNHDRYGKFELTVDFVSAPSAGAYVEVYMITAPDDSNYEDGSDSVDPGAHNLVTSIPVRATTAAQRLTSRVFELQPAKTKFLLTNKTGQPFPSSGSVLKLYSGNEEVQ